MYLEVLDGRIISTIPSKTSPVNEGKLCVKGWNIHEFVHSPNRLTKPLIRKNGTLTEASWDEALDYVVSKLKQIKEAHGADSIAFLASAKVTNEENYLIQKFARAAVGTNNVDHCARL
jgi:predicted molibdopterin-dependent oxidoreductase YjgC